MAQTLLRLVIFAFILGAPGSLKGREISNPSELHTIRHQIAELTQKMDALEQNQRLKFVKVPSKVSEPKIKIKVSGQINRAVLWHSNGLHSQVQHVDNNNSSTRLGVEAIGKYSDDVQVGGFLQVQLMQNSSDATDIRNSQNSPAPFLTRHAEIYGKSKKFGELWLGRGSMASDLTMNATDLSGTTVIMDGAIINELAGGTTFVNKKTHQKSQLSGGTHSALTVGAIFNDADGLGRRDRILYCSPIWKGLSAHIAHAYHTPSINKGNDMWDVALKYAAKFSGTEFASQIAYSENNAVGLTGKNSGINTGFKLVNGSFGTLFKNGISLFLAGANLKWKFKEAANGYNYFGKIGYQAHWLKCGITAFALDAGQFNNFVIDTTSLTTLHHRHEGTTYGLGIVQNFDRIATELYAVARLHRLNVKGALASSYYNIKAIMLGGRLKF